MALLKPFVFLRDILKTLAGLYFSVAVPWPHSSWGNVLENQFAPEEHMFLNILFSFICASEAFPQRADTSRTPPPHTEREVTISHAACGYEMNHEMLMIVAVGLRRYVYVTWAMLSPL